jgi:putative ABC transport system permease protein
MKKQNGPPATLKSLLRLFVNAQYLEEIEGDLEELYQQRLTKHGKLNANVYYLKNVLGTIRPYGVRNTGMKISNSTSPYVFLLGNHLKVAIRSLKKRKTFTIINVAGLSIAISSCILLTLFIKDELSFDRQFADANNIFRLTLERKEPNATATIGAVPHSFTEVIPQEFPEVERATALCGPFNDMMISYADPKGNTVKVLQPDVFAADSNFFKILNFGVISGDRRTMLQEPRSMVLTATTARTHFGNQNPIGKTVHMSGDDFIVTGVCEDPPANTHFKFALIISIQTIERFNLKNFNRPNSYSYIKLRPGADAHSIESKLPELVNLYAAADFERVNNSSWADHIKAGFGFRYFLCPLTSVYLHPENLSDFKPGGNIMVIRLLIGINILIFVVGCINFVNLATAASTERAKEVGIRKVIGSHRLNLILQFLTESFIISTLAVAFAVALVYFSLPTFNSIAWKSFDFSFNSEFWITLIVLTVLVALMAGLYPAFVLSSFRPIAVLNGKLIHSRQGRWIRSALVVFQFSVAIGLILCTMAIYRQMKYINEKDLGFSKEQLLLITGDFHMKPLFTQTLIHELKELPHVKSCAGSLSMPSEDGIYPQQYRSETMPEIHAFHTMHIGDHYAEVMGFTKVAGELFSENTNDSLNVILNETAVKAFGFKDPIGQTITYIEQTYGSGETTNFKVIGVVQDFHYASLHTRVKPLVIKSNEIIFSRMGNILVRLQSGAEQQALEAITAKWRKLAPDSPFRFRFMDHMVDAQYKKERQIETIVMTFSLLSILVACIGLLGLSSFTITSRTKEICIRKIVGARMHEILALLSKDFAKLIACAFIIAAPLSWFMMEKWWFEQFAFRTGVGIWSYVLVGVGVLIMALLTVSFHSIKAAATSPVRAIREG